MSMTSEDLTGERNPWKNIKGGSGELQLRPVVPGEPSQHPIPGTEEPPEPKVEKQDPPAPKADADDALTAGVKRIVGLEATGRVLGEARAKVEALLLERQGGDPELVAAQRELIGAEFDHGLAERTVPFEGMSDEEIAEKLEAIELRAEDKLAEVKAMQAAGRPRRAEALNAEWGRILAEKVELDEALGARQFLAMAAALGAERAPEVVKVRVVREDRERIAALRRTEGVEPWDVVKAQAEASIPPEQRKGWAEAVRAEAEAQRDQFIADARASRVNSAIPVEAAGSALRSTDHRDRPDGYPGTDASDADLRAWLEKQNLS